MRRRAASSPTGKGPEISEARGLVLLVRSSLLVDGHRVASVLLGGGLHFAQSLVPRDIRLHPVHCNIQIHGPGNGGLGKSLPVK